ncbi:Beta-galactosidase [Streptomyces tendae]
MVQQGKLTRDQLDVAPRSSKNITVPVRLPDDPEPGTEYFLHLSFTTKETTPWAKAGFEVARQQLPVEAGAPAVTPVRPTGVPALRHEDRDRDVRVTGEGFSVTVDKGTGTITSYEAKGTRLITSGPVPNFWRAPTDNDKGNGQHTRNQTWRDAGARGQGTRPAAPCGRSARRRDPCGHLTHPCTGTRTVNEGAEGRSRGTEGEGDRTE